MNESLFQVYVAKFFPVLQRIIEKVNGKRNANLTYWHKGEGSMLRMEYSPDNKWESTSVNTTYVAADFVAMDSPLPIKSRSSLASANGKLPKIGMSKVLQESDITALNVMEAQGNNGMIIRGKLANDGVSCAVGIDERNEYNFLYALSHGYVAIEDKDNPNVLMRLNFNYLKENMFGATVKGEISLSDIKRVIEKADADGNAIMEICIAKTAYDKLRNTQEAKELVATYNGQTYTSSTTLPTPSAAKFNEAFADDNDGIVFKVTNRSVKFEKNGKKASKKPWEENTLIFLCNDEVGTLVYGRLAEETNPVKSVDYQKVDTYKLISKYSTVNPLTEVTSSQAFVAPIIEDVDQIYVYNFSEAQEVDSTEEAKDTTDVKITVWGNTYKKSEFVTALNSITGGRLTATSTDANIIKKVNELTDEDEATLKTNAESAKDTE